MCADSRGHPGRSPPAIGGAAGRAEGTVIVFDTDNRSAEHAPADRVGADRVPAGVAGNAGRALALARVTAARLPRPGGGRTAERWATLARVAAEDLTAARVLEAHADALAILGEAADAGFAVEAPAGALWGVYAAEGPGVRLTATGADGHWAISGTKPWCSLATRLDRALVTAHVDADTRRLFAIDLTSPRVRADDTGWVARGLVEVPSVAIHLTDCPAAPVGPDGWYLTRDGFAWGGMGVAACWYGGAVGIARTMRAALLAREPDQIGLMHLGAVDIALTGARALLDDAARAVDDGRADGARGVLWAARVRGMVARAVDDVLLRSAHALGPAPLARDADHARRVADLELYVRQHHAERDDAALGRRVLDPDQDPWP